METQDSQPVVFQAGDVFVDIPHGTAIRPEGCNFVLVKRFDQVPAMVVAGTHDLYPILSLSQDLKLKHTCLLIRGVERLPSKSVTKVMINTKFQDYAYINITDGKYIPVESGAKWIVQEAPEDPAADVVGAGTTSAGGDEAQRVSPVIRRRVPESAAEDTGA